jgi:hypothetical protein
MQIIRFSRPILKKRDFFSTDFRKTLKYKISWKSVYWEPSFFHADGRMNGRTDTTKLIVAFRNFANTPKNVSLNVCDMLWPISCIDINVYRRNYEFYVSQNKPKNKMPDDSIFQAQPIPKSWHI